MKKTVLVVDDDASVRNSVSKVLRDAGYDVIVARNGQEAVAQFDPRHTDLLLLDISLPIKQGWESFERITREDPVLPIIVVTGQTDCRDLPVASGVGALLEKPLDAPGLLQTMEKLLAEPKEERLRRLGSCRQDVRTLPCDGRRFLQELRRHSRLPRHCTLSTRAESSDV